MTTTFDKQSLIQLQYKAVYEPAAALRVAYIYLFGDQVAYDKYAAFTYYNLYRELIKYPTKPVSEEKAAEINAIKQDVERKLKAIFYLNPQLQKTFKTSIRETFSTNKYRNIYSWLSSTRNTLLRINRFLVEIDIKQLDKILVRLPIATSFLPISEIVFELAIIAKNGIKCGYQDYYFGTGIDTSRITYNMYLAFLKEGRRPRLFFASMWLGITTAIIFSPPATGGLVILGITVDLVFQVIRGAQELQALTTEYQFIQQAADSCHTQLSTPQHLLLDILNPTHDTPLKPEYQKWRIIKEARLNLRLEQLTHAHLKQKIKMAISGSLTILGIIGTGVSFYPIPNYKLLGLFASALSGTGSLGWKLIESLLSGDYKTQLAIPEAEKNFSSMREHLPSQDKQAVYLTATFIAKNASHSTDQSSSRSLESSSQEFVPPVTKLTNSPLLITGLLPTKNSEVEKTISLSLLTNSAG